MSVRNGTVRTCVQCGFDIGSGAWTNPVYLRLKNGAVITRFLHGGPCVSRWSAVPGHPDPLRQIHR